MFPEVTVVNIIKPFYAFVKGFDKIKTKSCKTHYFLEN